MALDNHIKEKISIEVIKTLLASFDELPQDVAHLENVPFHDMFLRASHIEIDKRVYDYPYTINLHRLSESLCYSFFEKVAHILCDGEKREYTSKKLGNIQISQQQKDHVTKIITELSNKTAMPNLVEENAQVFQKNEPAQVNAIDFSADVFFEKDNDIFAIEIKTVKPNSGGSMVEKQKILEGKAALYRLFPNKQIHFYLGFPFDPTVNPETDPVTSSDKIRFSRSIVNLVKFFDQQEILLADDLWNFLSGEKDTMQQILDIINTIATPSFMSEYRLLNDCFKRRADEYAALLLQWNLFSEHALIEKDEHVRKAIKNNKKLQNTYLKLPFDSQGKYQWERFYTLIKQIDS
jgi:hypothetical protein